jgi:regulator of protease activity HflC (stomatin/prohibitin superfamily)
VRDVLNELHSEEYYISAKRFEKGNQAMARLQEELGPEGIVIEQVLLGEHRFHPEYEKVIRDRKIAEQNAERLKSEAQAAEAEAKRNLERSRGDAQVAIARAKGEAEQIRIATERRFYENQREAQAILAERTARAKAIEKQNLAMAGAGGRTMVKLRIAEALAGKPIVVVPAGSGASLQKLDLNRLIEALAAREAASGPSRSAPEAAEGPATSGGSEEKDEPAGR